jgi:hypothetical protein
MARLILLCKETIKKGEQSRNHKQLEGMCVCPHFMMYQFPLQSKIEIILLLIIFIHISNITS